MRSLILILLLLCSRLLAAQSYSSVQYNTNDGLASAVVYCMLQGKDGFIWFGTGAGLCRFDGTHFKTFTTVDGLPDNEILKMYQDSQGRIWMLPFKNAICYYFNGQIHNQQNDSLLKKITIADRPLNVFEDKAGTIWINELKAFYRIYKNNSVERQEELGGVKLKASYYFGNDANDRVWFLSVENQEWNIYKYENGRSVRTLQNYKMSGPNDFLSSGNILIWRPTPGAYMVESAKYLSRNTIPFTHKEPISTISILNDSIISANMTVGSLLFNVKTGNTSEILLRGRPTSRVIQDREKNIWIATLGDGVFRITSENFRNLDLPDMPSPTGHTVSLQRLDSELFVMMSVGHIVKIKLPNLDIARSAVLLNKTDKILSLLHQGNKYIMFSSNGIFLYDSTFKSFSKYIPSVVTKSIAKSNGLFVLATASNVIRFSVDKFRIIDTIWPGRATAVHVQNGRTYVGTLHGLYVIEKGKPPVNLGLLDPVFKSRIATLNETGDGSLWVGTSSDGLIRFKNGKILDRYTTANGLTSNTCGTVLVDSNTVWLGTNNGLNKICIDKNPVKIIKITHADGLASDQVGELVTYGDTLFVCTTEGITYFNKTKLNQFSECILDVLDISGSTENLRLNDVYRVNNKTLKISYVGISFKSAGDIVYKYRLGDLDTTWKTTRETSLEFVSLPYGRYNLELIAENKFGVQSNKVVIKLDVPTPFWETLFFYMLLAALFIALIFLIYKIRLHTIKKREKEKTTLNKKMAEMEMKALRAQMNPHFTFNVLNSIQYYIGYNDPVSAQGYLAKFSKLIRLTLDNSKNAFITLNEEERILKLYLDLERMRFENKFEYEITIEESIDRQTLIPNMLIQPFVENAIKHGFKKEIKNPKVNINMIDKADAIHCTITDNGVGRSKNEKAASTDDHQPAGVAMVMDKTEVLKHYYNFNVFVEISDLHDNENNPCGTRVFITFPKLTAIPS